MLERDKGLAIMCIYICAYNIYPRKPMEARRRVRKVEAFAREKPTIERARDC